MHGGQTSLKQSLHFLKAKNFCINSYKFADEELEKLRLDKLAGIKQALGLRLIENGDNVEGRKLLKESSQVLGFSRKATFGLILSYVPTSWQQLALQSFRKMRPKDYAEKVRESA